MQQRIHGSLARLPRAHEGRGGGSGGRTARTTSSGRQFQHCKTACPPDLCTPEYGILFGKSTLCFSTPTTSLCSGTKIYIRVLAYSVQYSFQPGIRQQNRGGHVMVSCKDSMSRHSPLTLTARAVNGSARSAPAFTPYVSSRAFIARAPRRRSNGNKVGLYRFEVSLPIACKAPSFNP